MEFRLCELAANVNGTIIGDQTHTIKRAASFDNASPSDITVADNKHLLTRLSCTDAGAVILSSNVSNCDKNLIVVENPKAAFAKIMMMLHPDKRENPTICPSAYRGSNLVLGHDVSIAPLAAIGNNVIIGARTSIGPHAVIGDNVIIGDDVKIQPNVTILEKCRIGNRVIIHAGSVIGSDGFGFAFDGKMYQKVPQLGIVQIDDDVEIGACNTIDRATFDKTWIKKGVKTDNLVHIGHNVTIGEYSIIVAQVGISGSVMVGKRVIIAGQAGISEHLTIGDNAIIGPQAGLAKSIASGQKVIGSPGIPHRLFFRIQKILKELPELKKRLLKLEKNNTLKL
ncbi:MAG: UDP-3-O-(3-hydroxymyristoyl)glucosamine N-acyltransferase [Desulfobacterales bacterium]|nr:UDP-3-O-(3-hydroxymyristoyl)glucosamine N-acyltransferase [Desulfobacterales bacterium]